ncbi:hypothetical protein C807_03292 [Lachnospiraceae bacterium 28-4]|jgi:GNAT superfamily N-acetyltransferase|nr:hypothetical protein C807_03292 [Lachnospiraceae bacterium 28-4]
MAGTVFPYEIRMAYQGEWEEAMALAWKTFLEFEADDYSPEGIRSFEDFITDSTLRRMFIMGAYQMFVAMDGSKMAGMITVRSNSHISLLFVDKEYHRKGIGKALMEGLCGYLRTELDIRRVTVNASPFGTEFYHRIGFTDLESEQTSSGIRYTPMELILK